MNEQLGTAATDGNVDRVRELVAEGASPNIRDAVGLTPLFYAVVNDDSDMVAALLDSGAEPDARDLFRATPLVYSADGDGTVTRMLLDARADPNAADGDGTTALHHALESENYVVAALLVSAGANTEAEDGKGMTPAMLAERAGLVVTDIERSLSAPTSTVSGVRVPIYVDFEGDCALSPGTPGAQDGSNNIVYVNGERVGRGGERLLGLLTPGDIIFSEAYACGDLVESPSLDAIVVLYTRT